MQWESFVRVWDKLRKRLLITAAVIFLTAGACFFFAEQIRRLLLLPAGNLEIPLIYISPAEALLANLRLSLIAAVLLNLPLILYQLVALVAAVSRRGKKPVVLFALSMYILFVLGLTFAYFVVFPFALHFFLGFETADLTPEFSVGRFISFSTTFLLSFGLVFQLPVVFWFLGAAGLVNAALLRRNRKYALLLFVVFAAILTPPDVFSQILMAVPLLLLYELGAVLVFFIERSRARREAGGLA
jgi:sec-independent protein translocase protein TatC